MQLSDLKNLKIAVVGAGYGGAAAAKALSLLGAQVDVYEQASSIREVGAGIGLRPSTMNRFREWGIFDAIADVTSPSDYFEILTATGDPIMKEAWPADGEQAHTHLIHRGDFIDALLGVLPEGMVHLGHKLESVEDKVRTPSSPSRTAPRSRRTWSSAPTASSRSSDNSCATSSPRSSPASTPTAR